MTAVLPNNAYYVSLDGSRRVTQRTRAHIKPIATFPLHVDDVCCVKPLPGASSDAPVVAQPRAFPVRVAADAPVEEETPAVEPAHAPSFPDDTVKVERVVDGTPHRPASSSPISGRRDRIRLPAAVSQPTQRTPVAPRLAPPVDEIAPKRRRGRPGKTPAPEPIADRIVERALSADADSARDASSSSSPPVRPLAPSADPALQPRVSLHRLQYPLIRTEARPSEASVADRRLPDRPEAARARSVTRSGRISRPPLFYGLGGDVGH